MAKANNVSTTSDDLEAPICAVLDMAGVAVALFDHASTEVIQDDDTHIKIDRITWNLLGFAIRHERDLADVLMGAYEARATP
jgi:hypothetical protein